MVCQCLCQRPRNLLNLTEDDLRTWKHSRYFTDPYNSGAVVQAEKHKCSADWNYHYIMEEFIFFSKSLITTIIIVYVW